MTRSAEMEGAAKLAAEFNDGVHGFANAGKTNHYRCQACRWQIVTIDMEPGVTPFLIQCENCGGTAQSSMYRNVPSFIVISHEWYRPDTTEGLKDHAKDHVLNGGLLLRPIE